MFYYELFPLGALLISVFLFGFVIAMDRKSAVNRAFLIALVFLTGWQLCDFIGWHFNNFILSHFIVHFTTIFWVPATVALLNFVYVFLEKPRDRFLNVSFVLVAIVTTLGVSTNLIVDHAIQESWGYRPSTGPLYLPVLFITSSVPGGYMLWLLYDRFRHDTDDNRKKLSFLLLTLVGIGLALILIFNVLLSNILEINWIPQMGSTLSVFLPLSIFIAIARFNFLTVDVKNSARAIFKQLDEGVIILDTKGIIIETNQYLLSALGKKLEDLLGKTMSDILPTHYSFEMNFSGEEVVIGKGDDVQTFLVTQKNMFQAKINVGKIILFSDITRVKENEKEIEKLNLQLKEKVSVTTRELNQAEKTLVENEYKQEIADLTSMTLHNVKNLLNSLKISAERSGDILTGTAVEGLKLANTMLRDNMDTIELFVSEDPRGKKLMEYYLVIEENLKDEVKVTRKEIDQVLAKVQAIENITYAQQGYTNSSGFEHFYLEEVLDDVVVMQENSIFQHQLIIEKDYRNNEMVFGDKIKVMHVLINMFKNAKEALNETPEDDRVIRLSTECNREVICLAVQDAGCGISSDNLENMFTKGFTTKRDGHGYGLYSSKNYMEDMKGTLQVTSKGLGRGSTFRIELPIVRSGPKTMYS
ncbi:MAG: ATP-binding protein [Fibrobacterales bacterium]